MKKFLNVEKITNERFLNLYNAFYENDGHEIVWTYSSRRNKENLSINGKCKTDAVMILPYFVKDKKVFVVAIKEFRSVINGYTYSLPAGIIEQGEDAKETAIRETNEEIGATVKSIEKMQNSSLTSAGLTDEELECFEAEIEMGGNQQLDDCEDITAVVIPLDEIIDFVDKNDFCLPAALSLKMFYYKRKYEELKNKF